MCLFTKQDKPKVSKNPITMYKFLVRDWYDTPYATPCTLDVVPNDILKGERLFEASRDENIVAAQCFNSVGKGYIHGYSTKKHALHMRRIYTNHFSRWGLFKCEIPAGTPYFRSIDGDYEICAKKIKFVKLVEEYNDKSTKL